jgi:hypothetical protein
MSGEIRQKEQHIPKVIFGHRLYWAGWKLCVRHKTDVSHSNSKIIIIITNLLTSSVSHQFVAT